MKKFTVIFNKTNRLLEIALILIFALLVFDVSFQVFSRYILNTSFSWTEELARFSLIWLSILGATYLTAKRAHLSMDFLYRNFSDPVKKRVSIFIEVLIFFFAFFIMVIGGFNLVYTTLHLDQLSGTLRIPLGYIYAVFPFGGLLIMCFSVYNITQITTNQIAN